MSKLTIKKIASKGRDRYDALNVDFESAIKSIYPRIIFNTLPPGCWSHTGDLAVEGKTLHYPDGEYKSNSHYHSAHSDIVAVEDSRKKLNLKGCPLFLLRTTNYNGDYRSLKHCYYVFGKNEDNSFFAHKVRPKVGATHDLDIVRAWMWELKGNETISARQGDLAFISKKRGYGDPYGSCIEVGNHRVEAETVKVTAHRTYALNPVSTHHEHFSVELTGWYELRLAKVWLSSRGD